MRRILALVLSALACSQPETPTETPIVEAPVIVVHRDSMAMHYATKYRTSYTIANTIKQAADRHNIPHRIAFRLVRIESSFNPRAANSNSSATGLMQVLIGTARIYRPGISKAELFHPEVNTDIGFKFLRDMRRRYKGDMWRALVAYNQGPAVADTLTERYNFYADFIYHGRTTKPKDAANVNRS